VLAIEGAQRDLWNGLAERAPELFPAIWESLAGADSKPIASWVESGARNRLRVLSPVEWQVLYPDDAEAIERYLPLPAEEWLITTETGERDIGRARSTE
jgi:hypothetical protein